MAFDIANKWFVAIFTIAIIAVIVAFLVVLGIDTSDDDEDGNIDTGIHIPQSGDIDFLFNNITNIKLVGYKDIEVIPSTDEGGLPETRSVFYYEIQRGEKKK